ncbi:MAG TPA: hypothetical protein VG759_20605 [Candidatus Angelobacter sp.]|nr:hypothetical protein [Candidatus Angelobacter sp.]
MRNFIAALVLVCFLCAVPAWAAENAYLYKVTLVQAAPGKLLELIELYKAKGAACQSAGDEAPLWMRHSQGDHWDLLILFPMGSYSDFYQGPRLQKRSQIEQTFRDRMKENIAWQEDLFVFGPPLADLRKGFAEGGFFHVEMFESLPGKFADLYKEREMENAYSKALRQPQNFIFVRDQGAAWDIFTIGVYRDLKHYGEGTPLSPAEQEAAAKAAGFESPGQIGPYLRRFIRTHHDTLAVAVK